MGGVEQMQRLHVVAWDPTGQYPEGSVIEGDNAVALANSLGTVLMPIDGDLVNQAVTGYFYRGWGKGWEFHRMQGERGCPMLLYVHAGRPWLHWAARIERIPDAAMNGVLRLTSDSSRVAAMGGGLSATDPPIEVEHLGEPDEYGGWTKRGKVQMSNSSSGYLALSLAGACRGIRVMWSAVSQTTLG